MKFHPAALIVCWCILVIALQHCSPVILLLVACGILSAAWLLSRKFMAVLLRRTCWIMLSLLLVYAYSTPGEMLWPAMGDWGPSVEGMLEGGLQLARLFCSLACLAMLLQYMQRAQLIAGIYLLSAPLQCLGWSRERFAVRLALTLHYADLAMSSRSGTWREALQNINRLPGGNAGQCALPFQRFAAADALLLLAAITAGQLMML